MSSLSLEGLRQQMNKTIFEKSPFEKYYQLQRTVEAAERLEISELSIQDDEWEEVRSALETLLGDTGQ
jgi:hypothetical protein